MKPVLIRNTLIFWLLLLAMAFGQEARRDPTRPTAAIEQRLATTSEAKPDAPRVKFKLKAIVLSDRDHGVALLETSAGTVTVPLHRDSPSVIMIDQSRYILKDFSSNSIQLEPNVAFHWPRASGSSN